MFNILMIYHKNDLPKNQNETQYVLTTVEEEFVDAVAKIKEK